MKMEIDIHAPCSGRIHSLARAQGQQVMAGQKLLTLEPAQ
jgi:biotin carboxyl carrier protein